MTDNNNVPKQPKELYMQDKQILPQSDNQTFQSEQMFYRDLECLFLLNTQQTLHCFLGQNREFLTNIFLFLFYRINCVFGFLLLQNLSDQKSCLTKKHNII